MGRKRQTIGGSGRHRKQGETKRESGHTIQQRDTRRKTMRDKTLGKRTHRPGQAHLWGDNERQAEARPRKSNAGVYVGRTMGDSGSYHPNTGTQKGRLWETSGGKTSGRRTHHPTQAHMWRKKETRGGKTSGRRSHNTGTHVGHTCGKTMGNKGGQGRTRPREGRRTIQQRKIRRETRLQKRGHTIQDREIRRDTKGGKTGGTRRQHPTQGDKAGQDLGKAGASATGTHVWRHGRPGETRARECGRTIQHRLASKRRAHHPQARMWGDNESNGGQ